MSTAAILPAQHDGMSSVPAFAQVQPSQKRKSGESACTQQPAKKQRGPRRKPGDIWPAPLGNEEQDVIRLWEWVNRGKSDRRHEMIDFRGKRMNVKEAMATLQQEWRQMQFAPAIMTPSPETMPQGVAHPGTLPVQNWGFQQPFQHAAVYPAQQLGFQQPLYTPPEPLQAQQSGFQQPIQHPGLLPAQQFGVQQPIFQQADALPAQQWGFQQPAFPDPQAAVPAYLHPAALPQQSEYLPAWQMGFDPSLLAPGYPPVDPIQGNANAAGGAEGLQGQSSAANGAAVQVVDPAGFELTPDSMPDLDADLGSGLPWENFAWTMPVVGEGAGGAEGLQAQVSGEQGEGSGAQAVVADVVPQQSEGGAETSGEDIDALLEQDFATLFNFDT